MNRVQALVSRMAISHAELYEPRILYAALASRPDLIPELVEITVVDPMLYVVDPELVAADPGFVTEISLAVLRLGESEPGDLGPELRRAAVQGVDGWDVFPPEPAAVDPAVDEEVDELLGHPSALAPWRVGPLAPSPAPPGPGGLVFAADLAGEAVELLQGSPPPSLGACPGVDTVAVKAKLVCTRAALGSSRVPLPGFAQEAARRVDVALEELAAGRLEEALAEAHSALMILETFR